MDCFIVIEKCDWMLKKNNDDISQFFKEVLKLKCFGKFRL